MAVVGLDIYLGKESLLNFYILCWNIFRTKVSNGSDFVELIEICLKFQISNNVQK